MLTTTELAEAIGKLSAEQMMGLCILIFAAVPIVTALLIWIFNTLESVMKRMAGNDISQQ